MDQHSHIAQCKPYWVKDIKGYSACVKSQPIAIQRDEGWDIHWRTENLVQKSLEPITTQCMNM